MAISFVGQASAAAASVSLPAHQAGDLILIFAYQDATATAPTLPAGFTSINTGAANGNAHTLGYKLAASSAETSGTWTGATELLAHVYRGVDATTPIGGNAQATNIAAVTYPAVTMAVGDGSSWVVGFAGIRAATQPVETPPSGMTNRSDVVNSTTGEAAGHDTNGGVSSWSSVAGGGTGFRYRTAAVELRAGSTSVSASTSGGIGTAVVTTPAASAAGSAAAGRAVGTVAAIAPTCAAAGSGGATGGGATIAMGAAQASAGGSSATTGAIPSVLASSPAGSAAGAATVSAIATGDLRTVTSSPPAVVAVGAATRSAAFPGSIVITAPTATARLVMPTTVPSARLARVIREPRALSVVAESRRVVATL